MRILIAGASGLIGSALKKEAISRGHTIATLGRSTKNGADSFHWDPNKGLIQKECLNDVDVVINLAGENIASSIWTQAKKNSIKNSRIDATKLLVETLRSNSHQVSTLINASAIGFYKSSDLEQNETSEAGTSFLSSVCTEWEQEANKAKELSIRIALPRIGIVLSKKGAALEKMILPFKLCLGGMLGSGNQFWSWISLQDVVSSLLFIAENRSLEGPINLCSPNAVRNKDFTKALGQALSRPTIFNVPSFLLKLILGEMADELLLASMKIVPNKLLSAGHDFIDPDLQDFLKKELGKS